MVFAIPTVDTFRGRYQSVQDSPARRGREYLRSWLGLRLRPLLQLRDQLHEVLPLAKQFEVGVFLQVGDVVRQPRESRNAVVW